MWKKELNHLPQHSFIHVNYFSLVFQLDEYSIHRRISIEQTTSRSNVCSLTSSTRNYTQPLKLGASRGLMYSGLFRGYIYSLAIASLVWHIIPHAGLGGFVLALKGCKYCRFREVGIFRDFCIPSSIVDYTGWSSKLWNNLISAGEYAKVVQPNVRFLMAGFTLSILFTIM